MKARKSIEVEIEDLHVQIDDIVKAKMSVSFWTIEANEFYSMDTWKFFVDLWNYFL